MNPRVIVLVLSILAFLCAGLACVCLTPIGWFSIKFGGGSAGSSGTVTFEWLKVNVDDGDVANRSSWVKPGTDES
jgi:hypothetical protein